MCAGLSVSPAVTDTLVHMTRWFVWAGLSVSPVVTDTLVHGLLLYVATIYSSGLRIVSAGGYHFTNGVGFTCYISFDAHVMGCKLSP